jgi:hypothetical protein
MIMTIAVTLTMRDLMNEQEIIDFDLDNDLDIPRGRADHWGNHRI